MSDSKYDSDVDRLSGEARMVWNKEIDNFTNGHKISHNRGTARAFHCNVCQTFRTIVYVRINKDPDDYGTNFDNDYMVMCMRCHDITYTNQRPGLASSEQCFISNYDH